MPGFRSSRAELSERFCGYCGCSPLTVDGAPERGVCVRCKLGIVLRARRGQAPQAHDAFLIVDERLVVQAISQAAERLLGVDEPDGILKPLHRLLRAAGLSLGLTEVALAVMLAARGSSTSRTLQIRSVGGPGPILEARVGTCGDPPAAVILLGAASSASLRPRPARRPASSLEPVRT